MKTLAIVCLLIVMIFTSLSPVFAGEREKKALAAVIAIIIASQIKDNSSCQSAPPMEQVELVRSSVPLGKVIVDIDRNGSGWDNGRTLLIARGVLGEAGFEVITRQARDDWKGEMRETNSDPAYNPSVKVPFGTLVGTQSFAYVSVRLQNGREWKYWDYYHGNRVERCLRELVATFTLTIADSRGVTATATASGSSWSRMNLRVDSWRRWQTGSQSYQPQDPDLAVMAACVKATNQLVDQLAPVATARTSALQIKPCVAAVDDGIIINLGADNGVKEGDEFLVLSDDAVTDPNTGAVILYRPKCRIRVMTVSPRAAVCGLTGDDFNKLPLVRRGDPIAPAQ